MRPILPLCFLLLSLGATASATVHHSTKAHATKRSSSQHKASSSSTSTRGRKHGKASSKKTVSHAAPMDAERATQIQAALIKKGYLSGEPTGRWDAQSISAMQKLQSDNGWQSKIVPDARGLNKLGLGAQQPPPMPSAAPPQ